MKQLILAASCLFLLGCQSNKGEVFPSTALEPDAEAIAELQKVVRRATDVDKVTLNTDVFSRSHILVVEPKRSGIPNVGFATGRLVEQPHTFHLLSDGKRCYLEYVNTGQRYRLKKVRCLSRN
jgi:hypothetical protein